MLYTKANKSGLEPCWGLRTLSTVQRLRLKRIRRCIRSKPIPVLQGRIAEAEPHYRRALAIQQKVLGPDHLDVASSLNNLALYFKEQARNSAASKMAISPTVFAAYFVFNVSKKHVECLRSVRPRTISS